MGRPRKYEADYNTFVVIKNGTQEESKKAFDYLFTKYEKAIWAQKHKLEAKLREYNIHGMDLDDYFSKIYIETFPKAVDSIKLSKIKPEKQATWTFWAQLNGYLMSHNRDLINHHLKDLKKTISLSGYSTNDDISDGSAQDYMLYHNASNKLEKSPEDIYFESREKKAFWKAVEVSKKLYSPLENKIWSLRDAGKTKKEICTETNIEMKDLNKSLRNMKSVLMTNIETYKAKYQID